jgi:polysaccharide pyruvyl transferase WcaK-like protein
MIFGAYANGNIGDEYQALSVARHIQACRPDAEVYATSASSKAVPFEFPASHRLDDIFSISNKEILNKFSALIIGGGGLFASAHRPLNSQTWADMVDIPMYILATGASPDISLTCEATIKKSMFVSARDDFSLSAMRLVRPDAELLNDPILTDPAIRPTPRTNLQRFCIIPRKMTEKNAETYTLLNKIALPSDLVLSMFPSTDRQSGALNAFSGKEVVEATRLSQMIESLTHTGIVVSERYHGCIVALKMGIPCIGLTSVQGPESKIYSLYHQLGIPQYLVNMRREPITRSQIVELLADFDSEGVQHQISQMTVRLRGTLSNLLSWLPS